MACSAMLLGSAALSSQAMALSLPKSQKKGNFQLPLNSRLEDGLDSGITTSATQNTTATPASAIEAPKVEATKIEATKSIDLKPFGLNDSDTSAKTVEETSGDTPTFKIQASESNLLPNGTTANEGLPAKSMKPEKGWLGMGKPKKAKDLIKTPMDAAKATNSMPLALIDNADETQQKAEFLETSEQKQIAALWDATLNRSPDIQFVVQKLVPTSDSGHAATVMTRMLGGVLAGSVGAMGMIAPSQAMYAGQSFANQALGQLMGAVDDKAKRKAQLGQAELISLYQMVRATSDKLVDNYRQYKRNIVGLNRATTDFQDLNNMMKDARAGQDAAKQLDMEYTVRKAQRDVIAISDDIHRFRQGLVDMSGAEAVEKLDQSIQEELQNLDESSSNTAIGGKIPEPKDKPL
ncbi:LYR motif-containing protein [bacterium]|nr:LYR motif-containing protein [bacterium]